MGRSRLEARRAGAAIVCGGGGADRRLGRSRDVRSRIGLRTTSLRVRHATGSIAWPRRQNPLSIRTSFSPRWTAVEPLRPSLYSHAGILLLHVALERRFGMPYAALLEQKLLRRLGLSSTMQPIRGAHSAGTFAHSLRDRVAQGYTEAGADRQAWRHPRPLLLAGKRADVFLGARPGRVSSGPTRRTKRRCAVTDAIELTHKEVVPVRRDVMQAHAMGDTSWPENNHRQERWAEQQHDVYRHDPEQAHRDYHSHQPRLARRS